MKFHLKIFILFSILLFGVSNHSWAKEQFNYQRFVLPNGLEVLIIPNQRAPVVYHALWYKVGSADSPVQKSGLAHFLEHLMFKGSQKFPKDTYKRTVNDLGGSQNANTHWDRTCYYVTIAKEYLPIIMEMEADRMKNLVLTPDNIEKEKGVVLQERRSMRDAEPAALLAEAANASFFWEHPYGKPVIGFEEDIKNYQLEDVKTFYNTWYRPNNAILVIAGDITLEEAKPLVRKYYGKIPAPLTHPGNKTYERQRAKEPKHREVTAKVELRSPQLSASFERLYRAPNHNTTDIQKEAALTLLADILGDGTYGRLPKNLVETQKIAHFVSAKYTGYLQDPYSFTLSGAPLNSADLNQLELSVESEIRRLISDGVTETELAKAKEQWQFASRYRLDSLNGLADYLGENLALGYTVEQLEDWLEALKNVTKEEVQTAAKEIFENGPEVTAYSQHVAQK